MKLSHAAVKMDCFLCLLSFLTTCAGFKVSAPADRVVAVRGQPAILGCQFTPDSTSDLSQLVITWQRVEDSRVVHSFYFNQDQQDVQNDHYRNRTTLFVSQLQKGNAMLRIEPVGMRDVGGYLCIVSNSKGADSAQVQLEYGAFYTEPKLSINVNHSTVTLLYETEGFPKPDVRWFGEHGEILSHNTELTEDTAGAGGAVELYYLKSSYVAQRSSLNVSFRLKNQLLNQDLLRPVSITYAEENQSCGFAPFICLGVGCALLLLVIAVLVIKMWRRVHRRPKLMTNGTASCENGNGMLQH